VDGLAGGVDVVRPAVVRVGLGVAEQFFQAGEGRPLLDWLQERSPEVAAEVGRVRRLAAR
jgi:hypothetical protein